jgi:hypothetical protein
MLIVADCSTSSTWRPRAARRSLRAPAPHGLIRCHRRPRGHRRCRRRRARREPRRLRARLPLSGHDAAQRRADKDVGRGAGGDRLGPRGCRYGRDCGWVVGDHRCRDNGLSGQSVCSARAEAAFDNRRIGLRCEMATGEQFDLLVRCKPANFDLCRLAPTTCEVNATSLSAGASANATGAPREDRAVDKPERYDQLDVAAGEHGYVISLQCRERLERQCRRLTAAELQPAPVAHAEVAGDPLDGFAVAVGCRARPPGPPQRCRSAPRPCVRLGCRSTVRWARCGPWLRTRSCRPRRPTVGLR